MQVICCLRIMEKVTFLTFIIAFTKSVAGVCDTAIVSFPPDGYTGTIKIKVRCWIKKISSSDQTQDEVF